MVQLNVSTEDGAKLTDDGVDVSAVLVNLSDYREKYDVVVETEDRLLVRDTEGHDVTEWADEFGLQFREFSDVMHDIAREHVDVHTQFPASYPLMFKK